MTIEEVSVLENPNMAVVKLNVTDSEIANMKADFMGLTINGIEDKEGFKKVYESRQIVKKTRVGLVKYADGLKEKALAWQRKVNAEKNRVVAELEAIESHLQSEEDKIAAEKEWIRQEEERKQQERMQKRIDILAQYGYAIDLSFLKIISDEDFEKVVVNAKEQHEIELKKKAEEEVLRKQEEERLKAEREELDRLRKQQAEAQRIIDDQNRKIREEEGRQVQEREALRQQKIRNRIDQLNALGMVYSPIYNAYVFMDVNVDMLTELQLFNDEQWNALAEKITPAIDQRKEEAAIKKQLEIDRLQTEAAAKALREKEQREAAEKVQREEELAQSSDRVKFQSVVDQLRSITIPAMKSTKAKKLSHQVEDVIETTIGVINETFPQK